MGIIGNTWVDQSVQRSDKTIYCAEDERVAGSSTTSYTVSPYHLRAQTLGDILKQLEIAQINGAFDTREAGITYYNDHFAGS